MSAPKPFGWVTRNTVANVEKMNKSHLPDHTTAMIRNSEHGTAKVPIYLGVEVTPDIIAAGNTLATIAFNLCQQDLMTPEHAAALKQAYQAWDHARRTM